MTDKHYERLIKLLDDRLDTIKSIVTEADSGFYTSGWDALIEIRKVIDPEWKLRE